MRTEVRRNLVSVFFSPEVVGEHTSRPSPPVTPYSHPRHTYEKTKFYEGQSAHDGCRDGVDGDGPSVYGVSGCMSLVLPNVEKTDTGTPTRYSRTLWVLPSFLRRPNPFLWSLWSEGTYNKFYSFIKSSRYTFLPLWPAPPRPWDVSPDPGSSGKVVWVRTRRWGPVVGW